LAGAGFAEQADEGTRRRRPGKVVPYEELLRAQNLQQPVASLSAAPIGLPDADGGMTASPVPEPQGGSSAPATQPPVDGAGLLAEAHAERLERVRSRIREGYYDRPEILEQTIERVLASFAPTGTAPAEERK
jgi:hypothetical protein